MVERKQKHKATQGIKGKTAMTRPSASWADWWQVGIQAILLVGAIRALSIYGGQLIEMQKANVLMKASTDAATQAVKAAQSSIEQVERNAHLDQRAWVAVTDINATGPEVGKIWNIQLIAQNTGKTFAKSLKIFARRQTLPKGRIPDFESEERKAFLGEEGSVLAPNGHTDIPMVSDHPSPVDETYFGKINSGDQIVFLYGRLTYDDIFTCPHWTTFCLTFDPSSGGFMFYKTHNGADDNRL
jgi:hypothetical protein